MDIKTKLMLLRLNSEKMETSKYGLDGITLSGFLCPCSVIVSDYKITSDGSIWVKYKWRRDGVSRIGKYNEETNEIMPSYFEWGNFDNIIGIRGELKRKNSPSV